jgi:predicted metal-dependent phosphoesterase TrpH
MRSTPTPLLCELHAHSTWSDGDLSPTELVDLYGEAGFDVLCITDHIGRTGWEDPRWRVRDPGSFAEYLDAIEREARRARVTFGLLVLSGLELTYDDDDPLRAAHAVAIGLHTFVGMDDGLERALTEARLAGAALVAAHPYEPISFEQLRREEPSSAPGAAHEAVRATARWAAGDTHSPTSSTGTRSSTAGTSSAGSPGRASPAWPPGTSTASST